ncbi:coiled-coil domain-containing protein [Chloropicon primus]|uniref:Uncharacterized protein n=1 Tax=Chloropicon primus TaxID=1764295 RepID=A0A5B8MRX1_9CHLO|nr:hypothetical protein A3770_09p56790 [Chloropicon primus]UPR02374.1 coiled-coil domain-containing protein [Chloropicon primus]|eukprot:QDZ23161.1 hypothetical protein A3770_09p56790 [Chloropicon primus]
MEVSESLPSWAGGGAEGDASEDGQRSPQEWLELIQQLLVAGGYFRARIPTLKAFDKVVGGLAWSINASYATEVDFDLFLREDAKIGEKIQLSEKIEKALQRMKCPHTLQAHQMEGLDYPYIFPVVQWLLTRVMDARAQFGNQLRQYSQYACESKQGYKVSSKVDRGEGIAADLMLEARMEETYGLARQLRRKEKSNKSDDLLRKLNWTLMEYGHKNHLLKDVGGDGGSAERGSQGRRRSSTAAARQGKEGGGPMDADALDDEFNRLQVGAEDDGTLSGMKAAQIVGQRVEEIQQAVSEYNSNENQSLAASHMQQKEDLKRHIAQATREREACDERVSAIDSELQDVSGERDKGKKVVAKLSKELQEMRGMADDPDVGPNLAKVLPLVERKHKLSADKTRFKAQCEEEREVLRREAAEATAAAERANQLDADDQELISQYNTVSKATQDLQQDLSKASRAVLFLRRTLDDIPNSNELTQYQKRFLELYDLIQLNLQETKNHYNTYNTISDIKEFLQKEAKLMNSVYNGFMDAKKTTAGQRAFQEQLEGISKGVDKTLEKYAGKYEMRKLTLDKENARFQQQLQLQRLYLKTLADLKKAVTKYEKMAGTQ